MLTVEIKVPADLESTLAEIAKESGKPLNQLAEEALRQLVEDREDYLDACAVIARKEPAISSAEVRRKLGLEN